MRLTAEHISGLIATPFFFVIHPVFVIVQVVETIKSVLILQAQEKDALNVRGLVVELLIVAHHAG